MMFNMNVKIKSFEVIVVPGSSPADNPAPSSLSDPEECNDSQFVPPDARPFDSISSSVTVPLGDKELDEYDDDDNVSSTSRNESLVLDGHNTKKSVSSGAQKWGQPYLSKDSISGEVINQADYDSDEGNEQDADVYTSSNSVELSPHSGSMSIEPLSSFTPTANSFNARGLDRTPKHDPEADEKVKKLEEEVKRLEEERRQMSEKIREMEKKQKLDEEDGNRGEKEVKKLRECQRKLDGKVKEQKKELKEQDKRIGELKAQNDSLALDVKTSREQIEKLSKECERLTSRNAYLEALIMH